MASMNGSVSQWAGEELAVLGSALLRRFFKRLYTKVMGMVPILVGALVLTVILSVVIYALIPLLPDEYQSSCARRKGATGKPVSNVSWNLLRDLVRPSLTFFSPYRCCRWSLPRFLAS